MFLTVVLFIGILAIVVLSHEFGHFIVAKKSGMRVDEFGFGFPPKLFGIKKGETLYTINLFPLGGFVKVHGEDGKDRQDPRSFASKPFWKRAGVLVAGVVMNFLVAYLFFSAVHIVGAPTILPDNNTPENAKDISLIVTSIPGENTPAGALELSAGDKILKVEAGDKALTTDKVSEFVSFVNENGGRQITLSIQRGDEVTEKTVEAREGYPKIIIDTVLAGSPAEEAGIQSGDEIISINSGSESLQADNLEDTFDFIGKYKGENLIFNLNRNGENLEKEVFVRELESGAVGIGFHRENSIGLQPDRIGILKHSLFSSLLEGAKTTYNLSVASVVVFTNTVKTAVSSGDIPQDVSGPVGIAVMTGTVKNLGFAYVLQFIALISLSLGILNIIPFPALDGGRFAFLVIEKIKGSPVSTKVENIAHAAGFIFLILIIILITFHDINRFF